MRKGLIRLVGVSKKNRFLDVGLRYNPLYYGSVRRTIRDAEGMDLDGRRALSERLVSRTMAWAKATDARRGLDQPLSLWPILEKEELRGNEERFRKPTAVAVPASTSGSTGIPVRLWRSLRSIAAEQAFLDRLLEPHGLTYRRARLVRLRAEDIKPPSDRRPPFGRITNLGKKLILSDKHLSSDTAQWFADAINDFAPDLLWAFPSAAESLARLALEQGLEIPIPLVLCSSEPLLEPARELLVQAFGSKIVDYYGLTERVAFARIDPKEGCFFNPAYGLVELRPLANSSPGPDHSYAEIIATGFWNESMPLVRFRTGDRVIYPSSHDEDDLEEIALGTKPFLGLAGRGENHLVSPRGEILTGIDHLVYEVENVIRMQLVQDSPHSVRMNILATAQFGEADREVLAHNIAVTLPDDMQVDICLVERLEVAPSGKTPFIIRRFGPSVNNS
jgi:phenylacetate-CoA ligase